MSLNATSIWTHIMSQQYWQGRMLRTVPLKVCTTQALASLTAFGRIWLLLPAKILLTLPFFLNPQKKGPTSAHISIKLLRVARHCTFHRLMRLLAAECINFIEKKKATLRQKTSKTWRQANLLLPMECIDWMIPWPQTTNTYALSLRSQGSK